MNMSLFAFVVWMIAAATVISVLRSRKAKRKFNRGAVAALLAVLLTTTLLSCELSGSGSSGTPANVTSVSQPTVDIQATANAQATAQANDQATATAQANDQATATAQANDQATATAQANDQATATAQAALPCLTVSPSRIDMSTNQTVFTLTITNCGSLTGQWTSMMNNDGSVFVDVSWQQPAGNNDNLISGASQVINFNGYLNIPSGTYTGHFVICFMTSAHPDPIQIVVPVSYVVF